MLGEGGPVLFRRRKPGVRHTGGQAKVGTELQVMLRSFSKQQKQGQSPRASRTLLPGLPGEGSPDGAQISALQSPPQ